MTRATLLQLLAHPAALTGPDVRALEELAQAFPYCQTAHLLLAKAAHDQGSMLAAQRLRRAATYATDRARLRQLIETPAPAPAAVVAAEAEDMIPVAAPQPVTALAASLLPQPDAAVVIPPPAPIPGNDLLADSPGHDSLIDQPDQLIGSAEATEALPEPPVTAQPPDVPALAEPAAEPELPAQAPPVRPPAEAVAARQEFGLAEKEPAEIIAYRLPDLPEPQAALKEPTPLATPLLPPFSGVADVGYAPTEGSRFGFSLVATALVGADSPAQASLPPPGEFFAPDALLLAHLVAHQPPPAPVQTSSLDLINSFLQRAPIASRRRAMPTPAMPDAGTQTDLSVRSTRPELDLASENLARILARQGKNDRAIAVYERLMVKHPEKMAYFAAQIESLRPLA